MSNSVRFFAVAAATIVCASPAWADGPLDPYLPKSGVIEGHVVTFSVAPEDQAISQQFRHAVQDNMDWFKRAVTSNKPGAPLPYDKRMGISEAQYDHLLHMKPEVKQGEAVKVAVTRQPNGTVAFNPKDSAAQSLKDVTFPTGEKIAATPFGQLAIFNPIHQTNPNTPLGAWNGAEWAQVMPGESAEPSVKLAFGKRDADGQGIMYYQVAPYKGHEEQSLVVFYKLD